MNRFLFSASIVLLCQPLAGQVNEQPIPVPPRLAADLLREFKELREDNAALIEANIYLTEQVAKWKARGECS